MQRMQSNLGVLHLPPLMRNEQGPCGTLAAPLPRISQDISSDLPSMGEQNEQAFFFFFFSWSVHFLFLGLLWSAFFFFLNV